MKDFDRIPRDVVEKISTIFREDGFAGASLSKLSAATGLGRSSLYHYFPNGKDDMAAAALAVTAEFFANRILGPLSDADQNPEPRLKSALKGVSEFYLGGARPLPHRCLLPRRGTDAASRRCRRTCSGADLRLRKTLPRRRAVAGFGQSPRRTGACRNPGRPRCFTGARRDKTV